MTLRALALDELGLGGTIILLDAARWAARGDVGAALDIASAVMMVAVATPPSGLHPTAVPSCGVAAPRG